MRKLFTMYRGAAVEKAAGDWIARCDRGLSPQEEQEFAAWEAADPLHAAELERLRATWRSLDTADEVPEIIRFARDLDGKAPRPMRRPAWTTASWAAVGAAAAVTVVWTLWQRPQPEQSADATARYSVVPSSAQRLTLDDGTVVELNGDSAVEPVYSATARRVRLLRGEAHFVVVSDPSRPFSVAAGEVVVRAVGTAFNVRFDAEAVEVLVTEGRVQVNNRTDGRSLLAGAVEIPSGAIGTAGIAAPAFERAAPGFHAVPLLAAGQKAVIPLAASIVVAPVPVTRADLARALAWQGTQFIFERTPLAEAVAAFNRVNRVQLVLGDAALGGRRLGGTFRADKVEAFVRLLETGFDMEAEPRGEHELVLRSAK